MILTVLQTIEDDQLRLAVERLFNMYHKHMLVKANDILHNWHDAEDAVQDTFYRISRNIEDFLPVESQSAKALLMIYTRNVAINMYNRKKTYNKLFYSKKDIGEIELPSNDPDDDVLDLLINEETVEILRQGIAQLDELHRDVIILKYYYRKKNLEIADIMCVDVNVINARVFRAKKKLLACLEKSKIIGKHP
jgi:RNA polymerase sigma-70 factor (ECF subfamily)